MTMEEKLRHVAESTFEGVPFIFDNIFGLVERFNTTEMPCICCTLPRDGELSWRNGRVYDHEYIMLGFLDTVPHDNDGWDNAEVYNRMKDMGRQYIEALNASRLFQKIEAATYDVYCDRFSNIVTGIFFTLNIYDEGRCDG